MKLYLGSILFIFLAGCATVSKQSEPSSLTSKEVSLSYDDEVSGICVNIVNQLVMVENAQLVEYSVKEGFIVNHNKERVALGKACLFSNKKTLKNYSSLPKKSVRCMLDTFMLESSNYYVKSQTDEVMELYNPDYNRTYITHASVCYLVEEEKTNGK